MRHILDHALAVATLLVCSSSAVAGVAPGERTADLPDSWLVLYNLNSADSVTWAQWYCQQRGIPETNRLGLNASLDEHLPDLDAVQAQIIAPVRDLLANDLALSESIMGIVLGYGMPGHYGTPPLNPTVGGFSVADALQDISDDTEAPALQKDNNTENPHFTGQVLPPGGRRTRANMPPGRFMTARIDAPSLAEAMALTERAMELQDPQRSLFGQSVWYDYWDPAFPSGNHEWYWLRSAVQSAFLADLPWSQFDLDAVEPHTPNDAFRFNVYQLTGWSVEQLDCPSAGDRVLSFDFNSWGCITARSTTASGGLHVPNALAAGYAAAIGATGEPQCCVSPFPDTILASLREGWTLGEAYYLANPFNDWMWTLVGDPLLTLPNWFYEPPLLPGDINGDGVLDSQDMAGLAACMAGPDASMPLVCDTFDIDADEDLDLVDFFSLQGDIRGGALSTPVPDYDGDGDVDLSDFEGMTSCWSGVGPADLGSACAAFDSDYDLDIDLLDYSVFRLYAQGALTNPELIRD